MNATIMHGGHCTVFKVNYTDGDMTDYYKTREHLLRYCTLV